MQIGKNRFILLLIAAFMLGMLLMGGICAYKMHENPIGNGDDKLNQIQGIIDGYYLNEYDREKLADGMYDGYVEGLGDPYSDYMNATEYESWMTSATGEYSGVGITFAENEKGRKVVVSITEGSPASKTRIEPGDYILRVNGEEYSDIDIMAAAIRGREGTKVTLEIYHEGKTSEITMVRKKIVQKSVTSEMLEGNTAYIKIDSFIDNTGKDFSKALKSLTDKGAKALILDLRDNGGGLVDQSVSVADEFLDKGPVCYVEDKNGERETLKAENGKTKLPTVLLVNENSASASEILAGALKDNGYPLVGNKTFGKGVIQVTQVLEDGSALKLTIAQYLSPDGHKIHEKGIKPNYQIKDKENTKEDEQLEEAKRLLKK